MSKFELATDASKEAVFRLAKGQSGAADTLSAWAQFELVQFCESLLEEYDEELAALLVTGEATHGSPSTATQTLQTTVCEQKLALCVPRRRTQPPSSPLMQLERDRLRAQYSALDSDDNGALTLDEILANTGTSGASSLKLAAGAQEGKVHSTFFDAMDANADGSVSLNEYLRVLSAYQYASAIAGQHDDPFGDRPPPPRWEALNALMRALFTKAGYGLMAGPPYAVQLAGAGIIAISVYIGGMVFHLW